MFLLAGLGNPGARYSANRHNIGFMAIDAIATRWRFPAFAQKGGAHLTAAEIAGERVLLVKPQTFMNDSGQPLGELMRYYKVPPEKLIVLHDELDLAFGKLRVKQGGGHGGHNGLRSIDAHVGENYHRVRLGIGHPGDKELVTPYVLSDFGKDERKAVDAWLAQVAEHIPLLLGEDAAGYMNKLSLQ